MSNTQRWQWLLIALVLGWLVWLLSPILLPFLLGAIFAYLGNPLVDRLQRLGLGRSIAASLVFLLMLLIVVVALVLLIPLIQRQIVRLVVALPGYIAWINETLIPWLESRLHVLTGDIDVSFLLEELRKNIITVGGIAGRAVSYATRSGLVLVGVVIAVVLVPVVSFYLLRDWEKLEAAIDSLVPRDAQPVIRRLARETDEVLGAFMRGQLAVMVAMGVYYSIGLTLVGLELGILIGAIAGLVTFVPYLGFTVGLIMGLVAALVQYHDAPHIILVLVVFGIGNMLENFVFVPKFVGDRIGLHPVAVIFAVLAFGKLFGVFGVLLALPMASVTKVLLRYAQDRYVASSLYAGSGGPKIVAPPDERRPPPES